MTDARPAIPALARQVRPGGQSVAVNARPSLGEPPYARDSTLPAAPGCGPAAKAAYDELPDGVVVVGANWRVLSLNVAGARMLGRDAASAAGCTIEEVLPLVDENGQRWWARLRPAAGLPAVTRQPERLLTLEPDETGLFVTARFIRAGGRLQRTLICFRHTTARDRHEGGRAELISTVAHELRSPLTSVRGFTATVLAQWDRFGDEQKKLMLETVSADADRLARMLSELLDVSRIDSGRLELHRQVVDLAATVRRNFAGRVASGELEGRFVLHLHGVLPDMWLDPDKIEQVVGNLVENAIRHGAGTVTVEIAPAGDGAEVTITDEGDGINDEHLSRVFAKFWRSASHSSGSGLGLYIAKGIVEAHGGRITAGRAPGGGARLRFTLPAGTPMFAL